MKRLILYGWLIVEFGLILFAGLSLSTLLARRLSFPESMLPYFRTLFGLTLAFVGLGMNFHPGYKLILRPKNPPNGAEM